MRKANIQLHLHYNSPIIILHNHRLTTFNKAQSQINSEINAMIVNLVKSIVKLIKKQFYNGYLLGLFLVYFDDSQNQ